MNSFGFYIDCTQEQTNAISEIPQVLPLIYCFLRGKEQSCKIPKIPAQAKGVKERRENEIVLDHTFTAQLVKAFTTGVNSDLPTLPSF